MIESLQNEKIKKYTKLNDKKYREEMQMFIASGQHLVTEASRRNIVEEIFLLKDEENIYGNVTYVTKDILKKLSGLDTAPKVLAVCRKQNPEEITGNAIILDDISDPGNLGTIIRSAVAFNYQTIILSPKTVDVYNPKVIRASEGMLFNINVVVTDLKEIISKLKEDKYLILGTDVNNGTSSPIISDKHALIIGSEAKGLKKDILDLCDQALFIKMNKQCESLNAAVAASILMYELNR